MKKQSVPRAPAERRLNPSISVKQAVALTLAWVAPTVTVVLAGTVVFGIAGTGAVDATLIVGACAILTGFCLAELGMMYPSAGGVYALARRVLPGPLVWLVTLCTLMVGVVAMPIIAVGIAPFIKGLIPALSGVDNHLIAIVALAMAAVIAVVRVELGAAVTSVMIVVESVVLGTIVLAALIHPHHSVGGIITHPVMLGTGNTLVPTTTGPMLMVTAITFALICNYEAALAYAEELKGGDKSLAKAVMWSTVLSIVLIGGPLAAAAIAAPNLAAFFQSGTPVLVSISAAFGPGLAAFINAGIVVALFTSMVGGFLYFGRILYDTGREGLWPTRGANRRLAQLNRFNSPSWGVGVLAIIAVPFAFFALLSWLVAFLAILIAILYGLMGFAGLWARLSPQHKSVHRPYKMPLWRITPVLVMLSSAFAIAKQDAQYWVGGGCVVMVAILAWAWGLRHPSSAPSDS